MSDVTAHSPRPAWWIPGVGPWQIGRTRATVGFAGAALAYLAVILANPKRFVLSFLYPVRWLKSAVVVESGDLGYRPGTLDELIGAIFLIAVLIVLGQQSRAYTIRRLAGNVRRDGISETALIWRQFNKNQLAVSGLMLVGFLYSIAFICPFLATHDPTTGLDPVEGALIAPFESLHAVDLANGKTVYSRLLEVGDGEVRIRQGTRRKLVSGNVVSTPHMIAYPFSELAGGTASTAVHEVRFILGTDTLGRDVFSGMIYGSRVSLSIGLLAVLIAVTVGSVIGAIAGYFGGRVDELLMRFVDIVIAFPRLFLILMIIALFSPSVFVVIAVLGATSWMGIARLVRAQFLTLKEMEFAAAAKALGQRHAPIIFRHLLPNALAPVIVDATLRIGNTILIEATLSFLGLGDQSVPTWGQIVFNGKQAMLDGWWIATFAGLAIVFTVVCFNLVGDGLRDALDPRLRT